MLQKLDHGCILPWSDKKDEKVNDVQPDFIPRDYQIEMLNRAKKENTIVMMPTGSGKTFVAVLLIKHYIHQVMTDPWKGPCKENKSCGDRKCSCGDRNWKRTFFLVNQVTLVSQQKRVLERHTGVSVGEYSGSHSKTIDTWGEKTWYYEFKKHQIVVMTTDIFKNLLSTGILKTSQVNVLVLDECHHAKENHPMAVVMRDYWNPSKPDGRVLGLTASVIDKKKISGKAELRLSIEKLQKMLQSRLVTPLEFVNQIKDVKLPDPVIFSFDQGNYASELLVITENLLDTMSRYTVKALPEIEQSTYNHIKKIVTAIPVIITEVGIDALRAILEDDRGFIAEIGNYLASPNIAPSKEDDGTVIECVTYKVGQTILKQLEYLKTTTQSVIDNSQEVRMSVKFYELLRYVLKLQYDTGENADPPRIIIFIERRRVVDAMFKYLCKLRREVRGCANLKASYVLGGSTGSGGKEEDELKMSSFEIDELKSTKKQQEQALIDFREGKSNILLATSVVEEGLDIPACNVVIRYDFPQTYRAYVQSRGRARQRPAKFTFFLKKSEIDEKQVLLKSFHDIEMLLREYASDLSPRDVAEEDFDELDYNTLIPPLEVEGTGAKITATSAIQRLNFYCSQLPKDEYTDVMPSDFTTEENSGFKTTITLPKLCPVKLSVEGDCLANKKLAKMSAAMKALEALYSANELTDALLPQFRHKEANPLMIASEDGRSMTLDQKLKIPTVLWRKDLKEESGSFYLYSIRLDMTPHDSDFAEHFVKGKDHRVACYGILCKAELPNFPLFTVHPRFGSVTVCIQFERNIDVPIHLLQTYYWFQEAVFTHALDMNHVRQCSDAIFKSYFILPLCWRSKAKGLQFSSSNNKSCFLDIDSRFITQLQKQWDFEHNHWIFGNMPSDLNKCLDSVIFPAYNHSEHPNNKDISGYLYAVIQKSELTAEDKMRGRANTSADGLETQTYEQYHLEKHGIKLQNPSKQLLECRNVTRHYAFLTPHASKKSNRPPMQLIGEICKVHPIPSSLWSQATCLPSILWRMETFCLSKELTETVYGNYKHNISLLASHCKDYFSEETSHLMARLRRDLEYKGDIDWLETLHPITHKSCGEIYNLERLEFLGDRFLKFVSTLFYYRTMPDKHEGWLSRYRSEMISNQNLAVRSCKEIKLPRYILNKKIDPKEHWIPPCFLSSYTIDKLKEAEEVVSSASEETLNSLDLLPDTEFSAEVLREVGRVKKARMCMEVKEFLGNQSDENSYNDAVVQLCELIPDGHLQRLETKDVADSMEALLGLCVAKYGYRKGVDLLDRIRISTFQAKSKADPEMLNDHLYEPTPPSQISSLPPIAVRLARSRCENLRNVEKAIGYKFKEPFYLLEALTHASFNDIDTCYQRLEFLGDAVLDALMVFHIYEQKPHYDQGQMTDLLSSLVCNTTLSKVCTKLDLHRSLLYDSVELYNVLARFFMNFENDQLNEWCNDLSLERVFVDSVESDTPDRIPVLNLESKVVQAPKLLGDLTESVIGAIYLDCGEDILRVWEVIWPWFEPFYTAFSENIPKNPKAIINELYPGLRRMTELYPGDHYKFIATVTIATRDEDNKFTKYNFKTVGRDRETAMEVSYGRALHFHKKYLVGM